MVVLICINECHSSHKFMIYKTILVSSIVYATVFNNRSAVDNERIAHGQDAVPNQFPYQISLRRLGQHICGGSIISKSKVVTAAHCVTSKYGRKQNEREYKVLAGTIYRSMTNLIGKTKPLLTKVTKIIVHQKFNVDKLNYDVAVVLTKDSFNLKEPNFAAIPLSSDVLIEAGTKCVISGWGQTKTSISPETLQYANVEIVDRRICKRQMGWTRISMQMICAFGTKNEDSGRGDSGGPMVCNNALVGIVSFGLESNKRDTPGIYAWVAVLENWIRTTNGSGTKLNVRNMLLCSLAIVLHCYFK